jgi:outer membrane protein
MKKTIVVILIAVFALAGTVSAQQKIGHINSVEVLQAMPEFAQMQKDLQKQKETYSKALEGMYADYQKKQADLQEKSKDKTIPDAIVETLVQDLQQTQQRIQDFESKVNDDLQKLQQEKLKPVNDKYIKVVKEVAAANSYAYVLDIASGGVAYYTEGQNDITDLVMKKLGITAAPQTPVNNGTPKTGTTPGGK